MTGDLTPAYRPSAIQIRATYPASDGTLPEEMTVELDGEAVSAPLALAVIRALAAVPTHRHTTGDDRE